MLPTVARALSQNEPLNLLLHLVQSTLQTPTKTNTKHKIVNSAQEDSARTDSEPTALG